MGLVCVAFLWLEIHPCRRRVKPKLTIQNGVGYVAKLQITRGQVCRWSVLYFTGKSLVTY